MKTKLKTIALSLALAGSILPASAASASERDDVMATVRQWVDNLNKGDGEKAVAACAKDASIVDEYPPYAWQGEGACSRWLVELDAYNKSIGLTEGINTMRKPRRVDITGDRAYVVVPCDFRYKLNGKKDAEIGALFTVALKQEPAGWRITGWAWSRP